MSADRKDCQCTIADPSAACKHCNVRRTNDPVSHDRAQGGTKSRVTPIEREVKMMPRMFSRAAFNESDHQYESPEEEEFDTINTKMDAMMRQPVHNRGGRMVDDSLLLEKNRTSLRKFEALSINGMSLTGMSISGFDIDVSKAAQKAQEITPIPAAKLPLIFMDETLNFYFHFFDGMNKILGSEMIELITTLDHHPDTSDTEVIDQLEDMIRSSFERQDSEQTTFMKKIIIGTFEMADDRRRRGEDPMLIVEANLYGLQYIEPGMKMRENDLRDWISRCHGHYKTLWFNTFKATSIPSFAYDGRKSTRSSSYSSSTSSRMPGLVEADEDDLETVRSTRRTRRSSAHSSVSRSSNKFSSSKARKVAKWVAAS